jgi:tape measure domain-containing protein
VADSLGQAVLTLTVDDKQFNAGLSRARQNANAAADQVGRAFSGLGGSVGLLANVVSAISFAAFTQQVIATGQAAKQAEIQIAALAGAYGEAEQATAAVSRISKVLGISSVEASQGFAQLFAALRGTGIGLQQLEVLFVGVTNAARLSGAGTQEAAGALLQLKQGLASGVLQGDELRSVLEGLPALSQAIAAEIGVNVGQLRKLGSEGKITSEIVFNAAKSLAGAAAPGRTEVENLGIAFRGLQAEVAKAFGPTVTNLLTNVSAGVIAFTRFIKENQTAIGNFGKSIVGIGKTLLPFALGIKAVQLGFKAWAVAAKAAAVAQAGVIALTGPKGWAVLAAAVSATALAAKGLDAAMAGSSKAIGAAKGEAEEAIKAFRELLGNTSLDPVGTRQDDENAKKQKELALRRQEALAEKQQSEAQAKIRITAIQREIDAILELQAIETRGGVNIQRQNRETIQQYLAGISAAEDQIKDIGAQIDRLRLSGKIDFENVELKRLVDDQRVAAEEFRLKLVEGASALRDAGQQLKRDLDSAILDLTGIRSDPQGLNKFLNPGDQARRAQEDFQLLLPQFREAQARFRNLTGAQAPEFSGSTADVNAAIRDFITRTNTEDVANQNVVQAQQALADTTSALAAINTRLADVTEKLAGKDWTVRVNGAAYALPSEQQALNNGAL